MSLRIVADENIPRAREAFGPFGTVQLVPGRQISAATVGGADALIVRSVTRVGAPLLSGSRVRFVGTATIGTDHVDLAYLDRAGITFAYAPGCNARSVAEYLVAALLELEVELGRPWTGATLGVVGVGNVGSKVAALARVLGLEVLTCDPPRAAREPDFRSVPLPELLPRVDVLTFHVPIEGSGPHPTRHLLDAAGIARLRPGTVVVNTSRGGVIDDGALRAACVAARVHAVLDVWETEPDPDAALVDAVRFATPHIAGYSLEGKLAGTRMIASALQRALGVGPDPDPAVFAAPIESPRVAVAGAGGAAVRAAVRGVYALRDDDRRLRDALAHPEGTRAQAFDRLRRDYPVRREFAGHSVHGGALTPSDRALLGALGFAVEAEGALLPAG